MLLQFLICSRGRDEESFAVAGCEAPDDSRAGDCGVADGNHVLELGFEDGVEVFACADGDEGVGVCERGEDADSVGIGVVSWVASFGCGGVVCMGGGMCGGVRVLLVGVFE